MKIIFFLNVLFAFAAHNFSSLNFLFRQMAFWAVIQLFLIFMHVSPLLLLARQNPDPVWYYFVILVSCLEYVDVCQLEFVLLLFGQLNVRIDRLCCCMLSTAVLFWFGLVTCLDGCLLPGSSSRRQLGAVWVAWGQFCLLILFSQLEELLLVDLLELNLLLLVYRQLLFRRNCMNICLIWLFCFRKRAQSVLGLPLLHILWPLSPSLPNGAYIWILRPYCVHFLNLFGIKDHLCFIDRSHKVIIDFDLF